MSRWGVLAAVLLAACAPAVPPAAPALPDTAQARAIDATIILLDEELEGMVCAGEYISPTQIATAKHCTDAVDAPPGGIVAFLALRRMGAENFEPLWGVVHAVDEARDLAVIDTDSVSDSFVEIAAAPPGGATVHSIGHPAADLYTRADGLLLFSAGDYHMVAISLFHGSSGGGLYDSQWRLIGVASAMLAGGQIGKFYDASALLALSK